MGVVPLMPPPGPRGASRSGLFAGGHGERVDVDPEAAQGADRGAVLHVGDREQHVRADELGPGLAGELPGRLEGALRGRAAAVDAIRARRDRSGELRPGVRVDPDRAQRLGVPVLDRLPEGAWVGADPLEGPAGGAVGEVQGGEQKVLGTGQRLAGAMGFVLGALEEDPDRAHVAERVLEPHRPLLGLESWSRAELPRRMGPRWATLP